MQKILIRMFDFTLNINELHDPKVFQKLENNLLGMKNIFIIVNIIQFKIT